MATVSAGGSGARTGYGAMIPGGDRLAWFFLRVSGALLVVFALLHMFYTHYLNVPAETTFEWVANRWANPLWRTFDWILLMAALWHGIVGLRYSIADYLRSAGWRTLAGAVAWVSGLIFMALGSITIFTFDVEAARDNEGPLAGQLWIADAIGWSLYLFAIVTYLGTALLVFWTVRTFRAGGAVIYNGDPGQYAWVMHRATGIGILFFLLVHIVDIMLIGLGRDVYDESVAFYADPALLPMEVALVGAVIYHTLNGLRIIAIDFWPMGTRRQRQLFWVALAGSVILTVPSAILLVWHEL